MNVINTKECLNCGKDLHNLPKKRKKVFCNNTCRSNYWQKSDRLEKQGKSIDEIVNILNKQRKEKKKEVKVVHLTPENKVKFVPPTKDSYDGKKIDKYFGDEFGQTGRIETKEEIIAKYENELATLKPLNETTLTKRRKQFLQTQISKLK